MSELDRVSVTKQKLTNIADQIRTELSESGTYGLDDMPTKIHEVAQSGGGGSAVIESLSVTQNGTYTAPSGVDGYSPITVAVHSIEDGVQWMRDFDFTKSEDDNITGLSANTTNCTYTQGSGLEWQNYSSKVDAFFTFNQNYNYDIIFKFDGSNFGATGSVATLTSGTNLNLVVTSDGQNVELGYSVGSGAITSTGIDIESLANEEIKLQLRLNNSNNWDVTLVITGMNYSQNIGTLNGKNRYYFTFGRGQQDSFNNWILKYIQIKQIIGDGSTRVLEDKSITTNGTYYPSSGYYGFSRVDVNVASTANLQTLNVTTNGTYTPTSPVDGWDEVIVDVGAPNKLLISNMNFKPTSTWRDDSARSFTLPQTSYSNIAQDNNVGISASGRNASVYPAISFNAGMYYEVELNTGDNSATTTFESYNQLFKLNRTDSHFTLTYGRDIAYDGGTGRWRVSDQSGQNKFLSGGDGNPHYLDNKKITICYGFKYVNGERVANDNKISWYVDDVLELEGTEDLVTSGNNTAQLLLFGGNAMLGFVFEDMKVYQHFNVPRPVSLMSSSPDETRSLEESDER